MEPHAAFAAERADFRNRHDSADFIVGIHDRYERRIRTDGVGDLLRSDQAVVVNRKICDLEALLFERRACVEHRVVLKHSCDQMFLSFSGELVCGSLDRPVVALRAAASKVDLRRLCAERGGDLFACVLNGEAGSAAEFIDARRVAVAFGQPGYHRVEDFL